MAGCIGVLLLGSLMIGLWRSMARPPSCILDDDGEEEEVDDDDDDWWWD